MPYLIEPRRYVKGYEVVSNKYSLVDSLVKTC